MTHAYCMPDIDAAFFPLHMTSITPRDNRCMCTVAAGLLLMSEQALFIWKNASQVGGTNMAVALLKMSSSGC